MERQPVQSSNLASIGYDPEARKLHVEFRSGAVYEYDHVAPEEHSMLMNAPSVGSHFAKQIMPHKGCRKV